MPPEHGPTIGGVVRQSTLRLFDQCPLRAVEESRHYADWSTKEASLGTAFHMVAEEMLRTLNRQGEQRIPTQEAVEIMREVIAGDECPHLSLEQQRDLRVLVLQFADVGWHASRIVDVERRLYADVPCPDGKSRPITGQPDVLMARPPKGAMVLDFKTSWYVPPEPRDGDYSRDHGRPYLSERGTFQLDVLGLLVMRTFPAIEIVELAEYFPRLNEFRRATLERHELEHVEQRLGLLAMRYERAMDWRTPKEGGNIRPEPRPGAWCSHCPVARTCPVPQESRGAGALVSDEAADAEAARWVAVRGLEKQQRKALKARHEETGYAAEVGDGRTVRWLVKPDGKRSFDAHPPDEPEQQNLEAALIESVERMEAE